MPTETKHKIVYAAMLLFALTTMEGGVMLSRTDRTLDAFDDAVKMLRDYVSRLESDARDDRGRATGDGERKDLPRVILRRAKRQRSRRKDRVLGKAVPVVGS